jgi:hypothetical protein
MFFFSSKDIVFTRVFFPRVFFPRVFFFFQGYCVQRRDELSPLIPFSASTSPFHEYQSSVYEGRRGDES